MSSTRLALVRPWSYHSTMSTVVKRSISLPADVFAALEHEAALDDRTISAVVAEATEQWLRVRRGLAAVREWEHDHGALTAAELAEADAALDRANIGGQA